MPLCGRSPTIPDVGCGASEPRSEPRKGEDRLVRVIRVQASELLLDFVVGPKTNPLLRRQALVKQVLIVDDSQTVREEIGRALRLAGFGTVEAGDGIAGLERAREQ